MTKDKAILRAMEDAARKSGYKIRWDKGPFRGGSCTLDGSKLIVLNRHHPTEVHLGVLARALKDVPLQGVSIRKGMREHIELIIQKYSFE